MSRWDALGLWWNDLPVQRKGGPRQLGPMPPIPETGWKAPTEMPNIRHAKWIGFDVETKDPDLQDYGPGWARGVGHIVGISCAVKDPAKQVIDKWYFPMRHETRPEENLDPDMVLRWASHNLSDTQPKIGANLVYDYGWCKWEGVEVNGPLYDVQIAEPLLDEVARASLDDLGWKYLKKGKTSDILKEWCQSWFMTSDKLWRKDIYRAPPSLAGPYAEDDAALPYPVLMEQWRDLARFDLLDLFYMECRLIRLLVEMRMAGVTIDLAHAESLKTKFDERIKILLAECKRDCGMEINANAAGSLAAAFDKMGIPYGYTEPSTNHPQGQPSFTADFLKSVDHPFAKRIMEIKGLEKLKGTFVQSYLLDSTINGKIHTTFHPVRSEAGGTRTGRFASSDPNLQNIPTRTDEGKLIREAFIMDAGHKQARVHDYSQIEYRFLAHFATGEGADAVRALYNTNPDLDYHDMIGDMIFDKTALRLIRNYVKNINFGLVYGLGIEALAGYLGVSVERAKELSSAFHLAIPFARTTMNGIAEDVQKTGIVSTILNRRSHFDLWEPDGWGKKRAAGPLPYRQALAIYGGNIVRAYTYRAINYKLQGSAADMMKAAMDQCYTAGIFDEIGVPRLTVHDELFFSDHGNAREDAWNEMRHICETCIPLKVPVKFDGGVGPNWAQAKG